MDTISERLAWARGHLGVSQRALGRAAGLTSDVIVGRLESNPERGVHKDNAGKLAEVLGCSVDWLLYGRGEAPDVERMKQAFAEHRCDATGGDDSGAAA